MNTLSELTALQKASTNLLYADAVQPDNDEFVATPVKKNFLVRTGSDNKPYSVHIRNHDGKPVSSGLKDWRTGKF